MSVRMRRILLLSDPISVDEQNAFIGWLRSVGMGWAHWLTSGWLLNSYPNQPGVRDVRANFLKVAPGTQVMVFEVEVTDWSAWLEQSRVSHAIEWVTGQWGLDAGLEGGTSPPALPFMPRK